ncbi:MAG: substrate-binding domain-containing protein, partial [Pseudomonadota bacterium]
MKKALLAAAAIAVFSGSAYAERYVMVTHTQGTDPFWPVVEKGAKDAAEALGVELEYNFAPSGDMADMAALIEAAAATQPDGIIVSLPDADALGGAITSTVDSGIPVVTSNASVPVSDCVTNVNQSDKLMMKGIVDKFSADMGGKPEGDVI